MDYEKEQEKLETLMQAFYKKHSPANQANAIDLKDPEISSILSVFSYLFQNTSNLVNTIHNDFYQLLSSAIFGPLLNAKPCATLIKIDNNFAEITKLKKGTEVESALATPKGDKIVYRLAHDSTIYPFFFNGFSFAEKNGMIQIKFHINNAAANRKELKMRYLDLNLAGNEPDGFRLFFLFFMASVFEFEAEAGKVVPISMDNIYPYGYSNASALYDVPPFELADTSLVMDYCKLRAKMASFRINITRDILRLFRSSEKLSLVMYLPMQMRKYFPNEKAFASLSFNCLPIVNLFNEKSIPVRANNYNNYLPLNVANNKGQKIIYSVDNVIGIDVATNTTRQYFDFNNYVNNGNKKDLVYNVKVAGNANQPKYQLQLAYGDQEVVFVKESILATLTCSNGLAGKVEAGAFRAFSSPDLSMLTFTTLLPSSEYTPTLMDTGKAALLINEMKVSKLDLQNLENLKSALSQLFMLAGDDDLTKIGSIEKMFWKEGSHIDEGKLIYGQEISLVINTAVFGEEMGELLIFCMMISNILATHSPINFYSRLHIYEAKNPTYELLTLPPICGDRVLQRTVNTRVS